MGVSRQLLIGIFIGVLIGVTSFYGFTQLTSSPSDIAKDKQISSLKNQVSQLQSENSQLTTNNSQLAANVTALLDVIQQLEESPVAAEHERVEFKSAYADGAPGSYEIIMQLKNTGTLTAELDPAAVFMNGVPIGSANGTASFVPTQLLPGQSTTTATISLTGTQYVSGMSVEVMIHTKADFWYAKVVVLP